MKTSTTSILSTLGGIAKICASGSAALWLLTAAANPGHAANVEWQGGTADYTNTTDWVGGAVPGPVDSAINDNGSNNAVLINLGDPNWSLNQILAGDGAGNGAYTQNGQTVNLTGTNYDLGVVTVYNTPFRLGIAAADTGVYTLNGGSITYNSGGFDVGELGTGILNINGGTIAGSGNFADNLGSIATPNAVTATVGNGLSEGDYTWFEQGYDAANGALGLPAAGTTITSVSQSDHAYTLPASYTANNAVLLATNLTSATIGLPSVPVPCTGLSFLCEAGNGPVNVNYTVHHADGTTETGTLAIPDWFASAPAGANEVLAVGSRVDALGVTIQTPGNVSPETGNAPYMWSMDIPITDTGSAVTNVAFTYTSGGTATIMGVSSQGTVGGAFSSVAMGGYNVDVVVEATAQPYVSALITDVVTQTNGAINVTGGGQMFVGNYGAAIYNLSGGSIDVHNYIAIGRSGGNGTFNMTGGTFNQDNGGNLLVGTGFNAPAGSSPSGVLNQSAGAINCQGQFLCPENSPSTGTYNLSGTGSLTINNWLVFGRSGGAGVLNMSGGSILQTNSGGNFEVGETTPGTINQTAGSVTTYNELWIGQGGGATGNYNLGGGTLMVNNWLAVGRGGGTGVLNLTNGTVAKIGNGANHFDVGAGGPGTINQMGGLITNTTSDFWLGETASATWNMTGGSAILGNLVMCVSGGASAALNLDGGVLQVAGVSVGNNLDISTLDFNGGTLQAGGNNGNFLSGLTSATVSSSGATIDSQSYNITIAQTLADNGGGSLTKNGTGTLTLTGGNNYSGNTIINAGTLITGTGSTASQSANVIAADNTGFGVIVQSQGAEYTTANFTLGSVTGGSLSFDLSNFGNPSPAQAPLNVSSTFTGAGTIVVYVADALPQLGQFPLVHYTTLAGTANFVLGPLPVGVTANLVTNSGNSSIDLVITGVNQPRWDGEAGGTWDVGSDTNWVNIGTTLPTSYTDPSTVLFDDNALGVTTVNLTANVNPTGILVTNNNLSYTIVGTGKIGGTKGLTKQGTNSLAVLNTGGNNYTGPTIISGGTLAVTNLANGGTASAIGASSAAATNLVLNGGTLSYGGPAVTINRSVSMTANSTIDAEGSLTLTGLEQASAGAFIKTGPATLKYAGVGTNVLSAAATSFSAQVLAGTMVLDGTAGGQTNTEAGDMYVGSSTNNGAALILTNTYLNCGLWFAVARGSGTSGFTSSANLYNSRLNANNVSLGYANGIAGNSETANLSLNGNSSLNNTGGTGFNVSENGGSTCNLTISDNSWLFSSARILVGMAPNAVGNITIQNNAAVTNGGYVSIGASGTATATLKDNAIWQSITDFNVTDLPVPAGPTSVATLNISNNAELIISTLYVGKNTNCTGTVNQSGGTVLNSGGGEWRIGGNIQSAPNQLGTYNMSGGVITVSDNFQVGAYGTGFFNQSGGIVTFTGGFPDIGRFPGGVGVLNLSGGTNRCVVGASRFLLGEQGTGTVNVSGNGVLICGGNAGPGTAPDGNSGLIIGLTVTGIGTLNASNGLVIVTNDTCIGRDGGSQGTLNLYGGTFLTRAIYRSTTTGSPVATGNLNFYGGTLKAAPNANNASFLKNLSAVTLNTGGAIIDTDTNLITIAQNLLNGGGGLNKLGNGTLYLNGANSYTNLTTVSAGTLAGTGSLAGSVTVAAGGTLGAGASAATLGTNTIAGVVTFSSGSTNFMKINKSTAGKDQLAAMAQVNYGGTLVVSNLGGTLVAGDSFRLFNATNYNGSFGAIVPATPGAGLAWNTSQLAVNGTLSVMNGVNTNPAPIVFNLTGGNLNLSWPGDHLGWRLLVQTNSPAVGLSTNWVTWPNSATVTNVSIPIVPTNPTVFFRLTYP